MPTDDELNAYKEGRTAMRNLKKDRPFAWWEKYANAMIAARGEAMRLANANAPIGKAYNLEIDGILRRERLVDFTADPPFPDPNTRKDAVALIDNLHRPIDARRLKGILAWRASLSINERNRLNHPTAIMRRWRKDTEPVEERAARRTLREMQPVEENPHLQALADTEGERDEARRVTEGLRGLLGRVLDEVEDLHPELRAAIEDALKG